MQRCFFFLILLFSAAALFAQPVDILKTEVSLWLNNFPPGEEGLIRAEASIKFETLSTSAEVAFLARGLKVNSVRVREGRKKEVLKFSQTNDSIRIKSAEPLIPGKEYNWIIAYFIETTHPVYQDYIINTEDLLAFNSFNTSSSVASGLAGLFYPSLRGDASLLRLNISISKKKNIGAPASLAFVVDNQDGTISQFWNSNAPVTPEAFYLIMGEFKEFDIQEIEEEFAITQISLQNIKLREVRREMIPVLNLYGLQGEALSDSVFVFVDSLSHRKMKGFFLSRPAISPRLEEREYALTQAMALYLEDFDTARASLRHWNAYVDIKSQAWKDAVLKEKWEKYADVSAKEQRLILQFRIGQWRAANPKLLASMDTAYLDSTFIKPLLGSLKLPVIHVSYRYVAGDTAQYVNYVQDTSKAPQYHFPVEVFIYSGDKVLKGNRVISKEEGRLKFTFLKVPNLVKTNFGEYFPGHVIEDRPDVYSLFQLGQAQTANERMDALQSLFKTKNPNLHSTALGIAMDDSDAKIRLEALENAGNLNVAAQAKLEDTLIRLSLEDQNELVRNKAKALVQKYYSIK